jgi:hypothetical protein
MYVRRKAEKMIEKLLLNELWRSPVESCGIYMQ